MSTLLSHALVAFTIELDNEFERRFVEAGGGARVTSLVMWSNFLRFVEDGIAVGELPAAARLPKPRVLSALGGLERWRYVFVVSGVTRRPPKERRDGWGSARGLRPAWLVRLTSAGRTAAAIWRPLPGEIEARWEERFGAGTIDGLRSALRAIVARIDVELPEYLPIVGSANGMAADLPQLDRRRTSAADLRLAALLSQALLAYTLDFEREAELSLPLSANFVRVLGETGIPVRELPLLAGVSKEATAMALTFLSKTPYVTVDGETAASKVARLTPEGRDLQRRYDVIHAEVETQWKKRFGAEEVGGLRESLGRVLGGPLARGLEPYPGSWRASRNYVERTQALLGDPSTALPDYPMVLSRGGWPDGS